MQTRERELHLRLDTRGAHHTTARRMLDRVVQQRRLAHARLAPHHQHPALTRPDSIDEPVEHVAFAAPSRQLCRACTDGGIAGHQPATNATRTNRPPRLATRTKRAFLTAV